MKQRATFEVPRVRASAYEAGSVTTRTANWNAGSVGPNTGISSQGDQIRKNSRHAYRNNEWISHGIDSLVSAEVGIGVKPRSKVEDKELRKEINQAWKISANQFDPGRILDVYGLQSQIVRARRVSGEVFIRRRIRRDQRGFLVPVQFQILESDFVPTSKNEIRPNGNVIRSGIESDKRGRRVAYWMYKFHPQEQIAHAFSNELIRVPAREVIHHFLPTRPGQLRGDIDPAQALARAYTFKSYDDAELKRKDTRAPFTGYLKKDSSVYGEGDVDDIETDDTVTNVTPGTWIEGLPGEEPILFDADDAGQGYADFMRMQLMGVAAGLNVPYEILSGDWSKVNDRLVRAILNEYRRLVETAQMQLLIPQVCNRMWQWWMDAGVLSGVFELPGYANDREKYIAVEHSPHAHPYISPEGDAKAFAKEIEIGLTTPSRVNAKRGIDQEDVDLDRKEQQDREKALGIEKIEPNKSKGKEKVK